MVKNKNNNVVSLDFTPPALPTQGLIASDVPPKDTTWMWWPRIPQGCITIIGAKGGTGKGICCADIVARTTQAAWPFSDQRASWGNVMWCETEDTFNSTVVPRLIAAGADLKRIILVKPHEFFEYDLKERIDSQGIKLIVLSPLNSFLKNLADANSGQSVREALEIIQNAIEDTACAVIGICHLNKKVDLDAIERLLGSVEYGNFVRSVLLMRADEDEGVRVVHAKRNLSIKAHDLLFTIRNTRPENKYGQYIAIDWEQPDNDVNPDHLYDRREDKESAGAWLVRWLREHGEMPCNTIFERGADEGHSKRALLKAKDRSPEIKYREEGFGGRQRFWRLD